MPSQHIVNDAVVIGSHSRLGQRKSAAQHFQVGFIDRRHRSHVRVAARLVGTRHHVAVADRAGARRSDRPPVEDPEIRVGVEGDQAIGPVVGHH